MNRSWFPALKATSGLNIYLSPTYLATGPSGPGWEVSRRKEFAKHRKHLRAEQRRKADLATASRVAREAETGAREAALCAHYGAIEAKRTREAARAQMNVALGRRPIR